MITIDASVLAKAMKNAAGIVATTQMVPILGHVRLEATGDTLEIVTSDLDSEFRQVLPLRQAGGELATTVEARRLAALAAAADPGSALTLALEGGRLTVKAARSRWVLPVMALQDFPLMPAAELCEPVRLPGKALAEAIGRVAWAVSNEVSKPYLHGVFLNAEDGQLRLMAGDGNVLTLVATGAEFPSGAPEVILPTKCARTLGALCGEFDGPVSLAWDDRRLRATIGDVVLTGKLLAETFPNFRRAIPDIVEPVVIDPAGMRAAIRRVQLVEDKKTRAIKIERAAGKLTMSIASAIGGEATEEILTDCPEGHATGFSAPYLDQMLAAIGGDSIELHQADAGSPALFRRVVSDGALGIVMPMRI